MAFMEPQYQYGHYVAVETVSGETHYMPCGVWDDLGADALDTLDDVAGVTEHRGVLVRLSAPGYLDCTAWTPYACEADARAAFVADGIDPDTGDYLDADA